MNDGHVCTCGDCENEPFGDRCKYELFLRQAIELGTPLSKVIANDHPYAPQARAWRRFVKETRVQLGDLGVGALLTEDD